MACSSADDVENNEKHQNMDDNYELEWTKSPLKQRLGHIFEKSFMADVTFVIHGPEDKGDYELKACKNIISAGSPVFYRQFNTTFAKDRIEITDVEFLHFKSMIKYLYTDTINLTGENVMTVLYLSKKYEITQLTKDCVNYIGNNLDRTNVGEILRQALAYREVDLQEKCLQIIDSDPSAVSEFGTTMDLDAFELILRRNTLRCAEITLFESLVTWATKKCISQGKEKDNVTGRDLRQCLGDIIHLIRFNIMHLQEFINGPARLGILTPDECNEILLSFLDQTNSAGKIPRQLRAFSELATCRNYQSLAYYRFREYKYDVLHFKVDKHILITGLGFFVEIEDAYTYEFKNRGITEFFFSLGRSEAGSNRLDSGYVSGQSPTGNMFYYFLRNPVMIEPNVRHCVTTQISGSDFKTCGVSQVPKNKIVKCSKGHVNFEFDLEMCSPVYHLSEILFYLD